MVGWSRDSSSARFSPGLHRWTPINTIITGIVILTSGYMATVVCANINEGSTCPCTSLECPAGPQLRRTPCLPWSLTSRPAALSGRDQEKNWQIFTHARRTNPPHAWQSILGSEPTSPQSKKTNLIQEPEREADVHALWSPKSAEKGYSSLQLPSNPVEGLFRVRRSPSTERI